MSQRDSGYARQDRDLYETPAWVTEALFPHLGNYQKVWEPACGSGKMVSALAKRFPAIVATDIDGGNDFLTAETPEHCDAIVTNPPYDMATEFCERALRLMEPVGGTVAMLLRTDFDHAKGRVHLFRDCPAFAKKVVLMRRIAWFVEANGRPKASPSFNHAWAIWSWKHDGPPLIAYGP